MLSWKRATVCSLSKKENTISYKSVFSYVTVSTLLNHNKYKYQGCLQFFFASDSFFKVLLHVSQFFFLIPSSSLSWKKKIIILSIMEGQRDCQKLNGMNTISALYLRNSLNGLVEQSWRIYFFFPKYNTLLNLIFRKSFAFNFILQPLWKSTFL